MVEHCIHDSMLFKGTTIWSHELFNSLVDRDQLCNAQVMISRQGLLVKESLVLRGTCSTNSI